MHELSLCQSLCRTLEQEVRGRGLTKVVQVELTLGSLSCIEPQALEFCFEAIDKPQALSGCQLVIHRRPGRARCRDCGCDYPLESWLAPCPDCGSLSRDVQGGDDTWIEQMEAY